ncbi:hypothetical protein FGG51_gp039 [Mycobacterium phage Astro]|uniref:Uncharacterized protein n=4 Tax=Fromanvirus TaxID=186764 RepID=G8IRE5_9CAUD|nr:hypothetical protein V424_gp047 [Mycobacterium phage Fredward]YP_009204157.1 hypothetical protein AVT31_gp040 [Mycobacterium phage Smeadley]YP_009638327.1 hypothetical protein FGG39_gp40 [Mycobacterium phage Saintus]YP_009638525.1 hypothetical protein FGG51_gp039 [Mycobacterium phage Astro]AYD86996.1 hypothetical protein SEA_NEARLYHEADLESS_67 [Mycobacterium phage NearlyHeadless]QBI96659.1 hypothetical protein SEA_EXPELLIARMUS_64 [Mycobacterium phage Expelliarmus]QDH93012.1 hypothetical pro
MKLSFNVIGLGEVANIILDIGDDEETLHEAPVVGKLKDLASKGVKLVSRIWVGGMTS